MLCRAILTAVVLSCTFSREIPALARGQGSTRIVQIKDVICVLLLSGLQKEELDADTMEKLRRHNVNIYDMNNEKLRQECLLKSLNPEKATEDIDKTLDNNETVIPLPTNKQTYGEGIQTEMPKLDIAADNYFADKADLRSLIDELKIKGEVQREENRNDNIKSNSPIINVQDDINMTIVNKEPQIEYIKSQPSLDSVLNFWSKFTRKSNVEDVTEIPTTQSTPFIEEIQSTMIPENKGYVHSREIEYVNRMISEYLASQTVPTTTEVVKKKRKNVDLITRKIKEALAKKEMDEEVNTMVALKNMGDILNVRTLSELADFNGPIRINSKDSDASRKALRMTAANMKYENNEASRLPDNLDNFSSKAIPNSAPKMEAIKYLDAVLQLNKDSKMKTETNLPLETTTRIIKNQELLEKQIIRNNNVKKVRFNIDNVNISDISQVNSNQPTVSADVIKKIAEKVKEIVLADIRKTSTEAPTTTSKIPTTTTTIVTKITARPDMPNKDTKNNKQVMQTLMELLKQYKGVKEATDAPSKIRLKPDADTLRSPPLDRLLPPIMAGSNPFEVKTEVPTIREMKINTFKPSFVQIPLGPADRALQASPYNPQINMNQKGDTRMLPITIQTNSVEIAPLAIPLAKPMPVINQQIIVTTRNPFEKHKAEQLHYEHKQQPDNKYKGAIIVDERNHRTENPTYADLAKRLHLAENIKRDFRDSYKDRIQRLKDRIKYAHDLNKEKALEVNRALAPGYRIGESRFAQSSYHGGFSPNIGSNHRDTSIQPIHANRYEAFNRQLETNRRDPFHPSIDSNPQQNLNRPMNINYHGTLNRPVNLNLHENINHPIQSSLQQALNRPDSNRQDNYNREPERNHRETLNRQVDLNQYVPLNWADDPNQRDRDMTREVLSRLVGSNHHDIISRLVEPNSPDVINRQGDLNQHSRSHHSDAYERIEHERTHPRYKGARFHEELERIENLPRNSYNNKPHANCCDPVAARQQMPLSNVKQRGRFDDTHFRNFLKSQQKVTDMLERILASKAKEERPSVEIS